jgi:hypothetical protein
MIFPLPMMHSGDVGLDNRHVRATRRKDIQVDFSHSRPSYDGNAKSVEAA